MTTVCLSAKGDGLVVYLKEPSVLLAMQILDGVPFRDGQPKAMTVTEVGFSWACMYN